MKEQNDTLPINAIPDDVVMNKIYYIRGSKSHVRYWSGRTLRGTHKRLNEQVKRIIKGFPGDFMFQLNEAEFATW